MSQRIQVIAGMKVPYYISEKYSTWVLSTGQTGFVPFNNVESANLRNYNKGQNIFASNQGRILALQTRLAGASFGRLALQDASYTWTPADELCKLVNQATIEIRQDGSIVHQGLIQSITAPLPVVGEGQNIGTPTNTTRPSALSAPVGNSSALTKGAEKNIVYFTPPLIIGAGRSIDFNVSLPTGISVPASLANYIVQFILTTEELPQANLSEVRN